MSIISSTSIFVETERGAIISYYTENREFSWELESYGDERSGKINPEELTLLLNNSLDKYDLLSSVTAISYVHSFESSLLINISQISHGYYGDVRVFEIKNLDALSTILNPGSYFEENILGDQKAVFLEFGSKSPETSKNITIGNEYSLFTHYYNETKNEADFISIVNVTITGKKFFDYDQREKYTESIPELQRLYGSQVLIVQNISSFIQEYDQNIEVYANNIGIGEWKNQHSTLIYFSDAESFDSLDLGALTRKLELLRIDVESELYSERFNGYFNDRIYWNLKEIESQVTFLLIMLFLFSSPVFILALFLAYYSFGLIKRQKFQQLGVMLSRGIKRSQLSILLVLEVILSLIIAIIMGILLSIPFSTVFVQSSGLLEFNNPRSPVILLLELVEFITPIGFILIIITNFISIIRTSKINLATIEKHMTKEQTDPFWKRKYLDVIFLIFGISIIIIVSEINLRQPENLDLQFLNFLLIPAPILLVAGAVMFISRIFAIVTARISVFLWKKKSGLLSFSLKNVVRHKQASIRAILLISINVAFIIAFLTFPFSNFAYQEERISYDIGAEMFVRLDNATQYGNYTYFSEVFENVSQDIETFSPVITANLKGNEILALNTTSFLNSAYFKESYSNNMEENINGLSSENMSILLYSKNLQEINKEINDSVTWPFRWDDEYRQNPTESVPVYNFKIVGIFDYFPRLFRWPPYNLRTEFHGAMSLETFSVVEKMSENVSEYLTWDFGLENVNLGLYVKPKDSVNTTLLAGALLNNTKVTWVQNFDDDLKFAVENPSNNSLFSLINSNVTFLLIITLFVLIMFGILQIIERGKEVATERALGMTLKQTFLLFIYETNWLLIFGLITGVFFGAFVSWIFIYPFATSGIPPVVMVYPVNLIAILLVLILVGATLFNFIPAYLSSKIEVTKMLKVE
ncbi:MAG: FtsX-like permease family protein [Candidatus Hodarchaeales archaeon]